MTSRTLVMVGLLFTLAGAAWGQTPTNTNECVWYLPCSTADCFARVESDKGLIIKDFGVVGTYMAVVPADPDHQSDCTGDAGRFEQAWEQSQGSMCNAFAKTGGGNLTLYRKLGGGSYIDVGVTSADQHGYPQNCFGLPKVVHPKYYILGVVYAPPGCTPSGSFKCPTGAAASSVVYSEGKTTGTTSTIQNTFDASVSLTVKVGEPPVLGVSPFSLTTTLGYSMTSTSGNSSTISGTTSSGLTVPGGGLDGINHDLDFFDLLLNPGVTTTSWLYPIPGQSSVSWSLGYTGDGPKSLHVQVSWLRCFLVAQGLIADPTKSCVNNASLLPDYLMPVNIQTSLSAAGLTNDDYQTILLQNPFWNTQSTPIDFYSICRDQLTTPVNYITICGRYANQNDPFQYEEPLSTGCAAKLVTLENATTKTLSSSYKQGYSVGLSAMESVPGSSATEAGKLAWTNTEGTTNTTMNSQKASLTVGCSSPAYAAANGPDMMDYYYDALYGTFLFNPIPNSGIRKVISRGQVFTASGVASGIPVDLLYGTTTYHTFTANNGNFVFYSPDVQSSRPPLTAELSVGGVSQTVVVGDAAATTVTIPQPPPALTIFLQSRPSGSANLSMGVTNTGDTTATNVTVTAITGITATDATFVYNPGLLVIPFVIPGAAVLTPGATSGFNLNFTATSGSPAAPFSFVITVKADNVPPFSTTINVPATLGNPDLQVTHSLARDPSTDEILDTAVVTNAGTGGAANVLLTSVLLGGISPTNPLPNLGNIPPGSSLAALLRFPASAAAHGAATVIRVAGTYTGGSFTASSRVSVP